MGKASKAHRAKVAKRNTDLKVKEKRTQKIWQEAFEEQMNVMREKYASMSGETMMGLLDDEETPEEQTTQEVIESVEPTQEDQTV
jgi:D-alanine-D-alanine ligase-like ATP-grasp enzyme